MNLKIVYRLISIFSLIFIFTFFLFALKFFFFVTQPLPVSKDGYILEIHPGSPVEKIADQLFKAQLIKQPWHFLIWVRWKGAWTSLKAGEYLIKQNTTPSDLIQQLREGKVMQHALAIIPGWTFERVMQAIHEHPKLTHTLTGLKPEEIMTKLGLLNEHPEGKFFADTYFFPAGTTDIAFLKRAYLLMQEKLYTAWLKRSPNLTLKSPKEALILASIIEKESSIPEEYADIAGVYIRRLERKMLLQADPTVIYGVMQGVAQGMAQGVDKAQMNSGQITTTKITKEMLKTKGPYNTYMVTGLPPTPIGVPSLKALEAALHPKAGTALYFVAKTDGKGHIFSDTLEQHQVAVAKYRAKNADNANSVNTVTVNNQGGK